MPEHRFQRGAGRRGDGCSCAMIPYIPENETWEYVFGLRQDTSAECIELLASLDDTEKPHFKAVAQEAVEQIKIQEDFWD